MLGISNQAQLALSDKNSQYAGGRHSDEISARLSNVMESSRHAHELIVKMLAYRSASTETARSADLSETVRRTIELIKQTIGTPFKISHELEEDLYAQELDVVHLQKTLIQFFRLAGDHISARSKSRATKKPVQIELGLTDYHEEHCFCCDQRVDGQFLLLGLSHGSLKRKAAVPRELLADELSQNRPFYSRLGQLHNELDEFGGHLLLDENSSGAQYWQAVIPVAGTEQTGIVLDNSVQLAKYRQRRKNR